MRKFFKKNIKIVDNNRDYSLIRWNVRNMIMKSQNKRRVVLSFISFLFVLIYVGCSSSPNPTNKTETSELTTQEKTG